MTAEEVLKEIKNCRDEYLKEPITNFGVDFVIDNYKFAIELVQMIIDENNKSNSGGNACYASLASQGVQNGGSKSKEYEALTIQALHQLNEIYDGNDNAFMDRDQFIDTYLDGLGDYEKKIAKEQGIEIR